MHIGPFILLILHVCFIAAPRCVCSETDVRYTLDILSSDAAAYFVFVANA